MDWNKAKTILIAALLITNLSLGGTLYRQKAMEKQDARAAVQYTLVYLQRLGVEVLCDIPAEQISCPVLFVSITEPGGGDSEYGGMPIVVSGSELGAKTIKAGDNKAPAISASQALQSLVSTRLEEDPQGLCITAIELVYRVDRSGFDGQAGEDTAVPAWKITTDRGEFFIEAFL